MALKPYSDEFIRLWEIYPNGAGKRYAFTKYEKLNQADRDLLFKYVSTNDFKKDFVPHLSTTINQRRFEDVIEPKKSVTPYYDLARKKAIELQKKEEAEREKVTELTIEQMAQQIVNRRPDRSISDLKKEIRAMSMVGKDSKPGDRLYELRKKMARVLVHIWGKEVYMDTWNDMYEVTVEVSKDRKKTLLEQAKDMVQ